MTGKKIVHTIPKSVFLLLSCDVAMIFFTPAMTLMIRVDSVLIHNYSRLFLLYFLISLPIKLLSFFYFRLYNRLWKYAGFQDVLDIFKALFCSFGSLFLLYIILVLSGIPGKYGIVIPRSFLFLDFILTAGLLGITRFLSRILDIYQTNLRQVQNVKHVLIVGAGMNGLLLANALSKIRDQKLEGFVDDDPKKEGKMIAGQIVIGNLAGLPGVLDRIKVDYIYLSIRNLDSDKYRQILSIANRKNVKLRVLSNISDLFADKNVVIQNLRDLKIEDLLHRSPVKLDTGNVRRMLSQKRILVTGAGGSIGSELCRQIMEFDPEHLVLLGHGENSLFEINNELLKKFPKEKMTVEVADVRDEKRLEHIFEKHRPAIVFHAAAHKHVPMMETNVCEAVSNNVGGTRCLVRMAEKHGVDQLVTISTDKAVNPTNVMGTTKRITELIVRGAAQRTGKPYVSVRFGNVLGSRGSVIPYFKKQIESGGPVTVTDENMTRFFMTIPEATQLVLQAATLGRHNETFVLDMGVPVKIIDLARDMIALAGLTVGVDINIQITGLRPGEKLYEELFGGGEKPIPSECPKIFMTPHEHVDEKKLENEVGALLEALEKGDEQQMRRLLKSLVPESSI